MTPTTNDTIVESGLRGLRARPGPRFGAAVLREVGIVDDYAPAETVVGQVYVAMSRRGVSRVHTAGSAEEFEELYTTEFGRPLRRVGLPVPIGRALENGDGTALDYDLRGLSEYWRSVLHATLGIPRGAVRSYSWVAGEAGRPRAVRAAGSALAGNPVPLLIPCHRVVRIDGRIGEYGLGGPSNKRRLLSHEGLDVDALLPWTRGEADPKY
ncbi:MAG TPA: MGMT family protein [Candidatus Dormibacteraeota bacterium]|nr:MGMT family protein [Candidatus Dormibacteraeota bacterium]